jgi:hypothetical protein
MEGIQKLLMTRKPVRVAITVSYRVSEALAERSQVEGRSLSNLAAFLLEDRLTMETKSKTPTNTTPNHVRNHVYR